MLSRQLLPGDCGCAQLVQGADDLRRHRDPAPGPRRCDERRIYEREAAPFAGEAGNHLGPAARLLEGALEDALSAEDEALLADFVKRHGGQYPVRADAVPGLPAKDQNLLSPPADDRKLLMARPENSTSPQMVQPKEKSDE